MKKEQKRYEQESFTARLQMEREARQEVNARLRALELAMRNQGRIK